MIKYYCDNCNITTETSLCPICHNKTRLFESQIYYSNKFNTPVFLNDNNDNLEEIGSDIRPVFPEERLLLEVLLKKPFAYANKAVWNTGGNRYLINGKKIIVSYKDLRLNNDPIKVIEELAKYKDENQKYIEPNIKI